MSGPSFRRSHSLPSKGTVRRDCLSDLEKARARSGDGVGCGERECNVPRSSPDPDSSASCAHAHDAESPVFQPPVGHFSAFDSTGAGKATASPTPAKLQGDGVLGARAPPGPVSSSSIRIVLLI